MLSVDVMTPYNLTQLSSFENLQSLVLEYVHDMASASEPSIADLSVSPALRKLNLGTSGTSLSFVEIELDPIAFAWPQLSHLCVSLAISIDPVTMLRILRQYMKLVGCDISRW